MFECQRKLREIQAGREVTQAIMKRMVMERCRAVLSALKAGGEGAARSAALQTGEEGDSDKWVAEGLVDHMLIDYFLRPDAAQLPDSPDVPDVLEQGMFSQ